MSPKTHTAIRTVASIVFLCFASVAPWLTPAKALTLLGSLTAIVGGVLALSNLFHVPAKVREVMQDVLDVGDDVRDAIPATTFIAAKRIAGGVLLILGLGAGVGGAASMQACTAQQGQEVQTVAGPVAVGALDGFMCVADIAVALNGPTDIVAIVQQCARFGVDAAEVYAVVSSLLKQHQASVMADAGLPDVAAALAPDPLTVHLVAILASKASGR